MKTEIKVNFFFTFSLSKEKCAFFSQSIIFHCAQYNNYINSIFMCKRVKTKETKIAFSLKTEAKNENGKITSSVNLV